MKNTLTDLNNYLFEQLERLNDDALQDGDLEKELKKADAVVKISEKIIANGELAYKVMKFQGDYGIMPDPEKLPPMLGVLR